MLDIFITTFNRKKITEKCLSQIEELKLCNYANVHVHDDGSEQYNNEWIASFKPSKVTFSNKAGIDTIMLNKLILFKNSNYQYFYSYDNDIIHDPTFIKQAFYFYKKYDLPLTLYRTRFHTKNKLNENDEIFVLRSFPGASLFIHKKDIAHIQNDRIINKDPALSWDWHMTHLLGRRFVCPKISYCDHYPAGGLHDNRSDIASNPTDYLKQYRKKIKL